MAAKHYGRGPRARGRIQKQPGTELTVSKDSAATLTEIWDGMWADLVSQTPQKDAAHPDFPGLLFESKRITLGKLGRATATLTYKGLDPSIPYVPGTAGGEGTYPELPEVDLEVDTEVEEVPIKAHPNFAALVAAAGTGKNKAWFDPDSGLFMGFGPDSGGDLAGVESYQVPRAIITRHFYSYQRATEPVGVSASIDGISGLRISMRSTRQGRVWRNTEVVREGNPNPLIYGS